MITQVQVQGKDDPAASTISVSNLKYMYWNFKQQLVHHRYRSLPFNSVWVQSNLASSVNCLLLV